MFLYLIQHAEALSKEEDATQSLSDKGIRDIEKVAAFISGSGIKLKNICHSGKMRSIQTAQILSDHIKPEKGTKLADALDPMDDPETWYTMLNDSRENVMLVGHLPHLEKLSSWLLCGDKDKKVIDFQMGSIVCLNRSEDGSWAIEWMITPEMIR